MRPVHPGRARLLAAPLAALLLATAGCDLALSGFREEESDVWTRSYPLSPAGRVEITTTNGFIDVTAGDGRTVEVKAVRVARAATKQAARELLDKLAIREEVTPDQVKLTAERPRTGMGGGTEVRYTVTVPRTAHVAFTSTNGRISVSGVQGEATLGTTNGEIEARDLAGRVKASSTNGSVTLDLAALADSVSASTTNGAVVVKVPADARASVSARWTNGGFEASGLSMEEVEKSRRRFEGRLNGGGSRIELETTNGGITVQRR